MSTAHATQQLIWAKWLSVWYCPTAQQAVLALLLSVQHIGICGSGILLRYWSVRISAHPLCALGCSARWRTVGELSCQM